MSVSGAPAHVIATAAAILIAACAAAFAATAGARPIHVTQEHQPLLRIWSKQLPSLQAEFLRAGHMSCHACRGPQAQWAVPLAYLLHKLLKLLCRKLLALPCVALRPLQGDE